MTGPLSFAKAAALRLDQADAATLYVGYAVPGTTDSEASWRIMKITTTGTVDVIEYANGNSSYNAIWNDRASLIYS